MRKLPLIFGLMLLAGLIAWESYDFLVTNDGINYFTAHPRRLFYLLAIGIVGGFLTLGFSRLSPGARRTLQLTALGGFGGCVTAVLAIFAAWVPSYSPEISESRAWGWFIAVLMSLAVIAALVWLEFYSVWRRR